MRAHIEGTLKEGGPLRVNLLDGAFQFDVQELGTRLPRPPSQQERGNFPSPPGRGTG